MGDLRIAPSGRSILDRHFSNGKGESVDAPDGGIAFPRCGWVILRLNDFDTAHVPLEKWRSIRTNGLWRLIVYPRALAQLLLSRLVLLGFTVTFLCGFSWLAVFGALHGSTFFAGEKCLTILLLDFFGESYFVDQFYPTFSLEGSLYHE